MTVALLACTTLVGGIAVAAHAGARTSQTGVARPGPAAAASGSKETFLLSYGPHESEVVVAHGAIVGGGKDVQHGQYDVLQLGGGSVRINHPDSKSHVHQHFDPKTCFASFTITGPYTLSHGTGRYAGTTGHGTYKVTGNALAKRKNGACNTHTNPKVEAAYIKATGPITK